MSQHEPGDKHVHRFSVFVALLTMFVAGWVVGTIHPLTFGNEPEQGYTVADCAEWADSASPVLDPRTRTDVCASQTESGAWIMSSPTNPSPALTAPVTR